MRSSGLGARLIDAGRSQLVTSTIVLAALFVSQVGVGRRFGNPGLGEYTVTLFAIYLASVAAMVALPLIASREIAHLHESGDRSREARVAGTGLFLLLLFGIASGAVLSAMWTSLGRALDANLGFSAGVAPAVVGGALNVYATRLLQSKLQMAAAALVMLAQPFAVVMTLGWTAFVPGMSPSEMAVTGYLAAGASAVVAFVSLRISPRPDWDSARSLLSSALPYAPLSYVNNLASWGDRLVVSFALGPLSLGLYQAAVALSEGLLRLVRAASPFLVSAYSRASARGTDPGVRLRRISLRIWVTYAAVLSAGLIAAADGIVTTVYGPGFASATTAVRLLAASLVPTAVTVTMLTAGLGMDQRGALAIARIATPAQLVAGWIAATAVGIGGMAAVQLASMSVVGVAQLQWCRDPELRVNGQIGGRILLSAVITLTVGVILAQAPVHWTMRGAAAALIAGYAAARLLIVGEERFVLRKLVTFWERASDSPT